MEVFCKDLKKQAMKIINYQKKKEIILTNEEKESYENQKRCHICKKEFCTDKNKTEFKKKQKVRDHDHYRGAAHSDCKFYQEAWLKPYINMNTTLRTEAKNDFEKDFFKLMNNSFIEILK